MMRQRGPAAAYGALLRLVVVAAVFICRSATSVHSCRRQLVFGVNDGYACDVIVTSSQNGDSAMLTAVSSGARQVPRNASALRLTLRHRPGRDGNRTSPRVPMPHLPQLRSLEVDVSETASFPAGLLSQLGATFVEQLSLFRSTSTVVPDYQLRLPSSADLETFATSNSSLSTLVLSDLGIEHLPPTTFHGLSSLCFLMVNNNRLSSLPPGLFDDLCQLTSLSLAVNRFVDVEDLSLTGTGPTRRLPCGGGLARLRSLDLHGNLLRRLRAGAFRSLRSVVELNLSENELSVVDGGAFSGLVELRTLYIDTNRLVSVLPGIFSGISGLTTLDVGFNRLSDVASGAFRHLTRLRTLRLNENAIQTVSSEAWFGLDELTSLDLASNRLAAVNESMFRGLCNLRRLDLSDNEVTIARAEAFACLTALEWLDLSENHLSDADQHQIEATRWWLNDLGGQVVCDRCVNALPTTMTSAATNNVAFIVLPSQSSSSSSSSARVNISHLLVAALTVGAVLMASCLTLAAGAYLFRRRRAMLDWHIRSETYSTCSRHSGNTLDDSVDGLYVKYNT